MNQEQFDRMAQAMAELNETIRGKKAGQEGDLNRDALEAEIKRILAEQKGVGRKGEFDVGDKSFDDKSLDDIREKHSLATGYSDVIESAKDEAEMWDLLYLASKTLRQPIQSLKLFGLAKRRFKAMDTATTGEGSEWVPTGFSSELVRKVNLALKVAALFDRVTMPTDNWTLPVEGADATAYLASQATSDTATKFTASTPGTSNVAFGAKKLAVRVLTSKELEEDSVVAVLPFMQMKVVKALAEAQEEGVLNGDDSTTHQDSDIHALGASDRRKAWKGLRKHALALGTATKDLSTFSADNLRALRALMGKYGVAPNSLAWVSGIITYLNKFLTLDEVQTVDKYGAGATILSGELAKFDGIPLIVSEFQRENLNASGVYDGDTTDNGALALVYRPAYMIGDRRNVTVQVLRELYAETDQDAIIATQRLDFEDVIDATAEKVVALGYNIDCA